MGQHLNVNNVPFKELMMLTQVNIFDGASNRITFEQVYSKKFKCEYMLDLYPFDTQVADFSFNLVYVL